MNHGQSCGKIQRVINKAKAYLLTLGVVLIWGSFAAVSKLSLKDLDSFQLQFYIFLVATLVNLLILLFLNKLDLLRRLSFDSVKKLVLYAIPAFFYYFLYWLSLKLIPASEAMMLNYIWPIMVVVFAIPIFKEKLTLKKLLAILLGFIGVLIIVTRGNILSLRLSNPLGDFLALLAGCCWGLFSNLGRKSKEDTNISYFIYFTTMFLLSIPSLLLLSKPVLPTQRSFLGILSLGTLNLALAYFLWFEALELGQIASVASLAYLTPFASLVYIFILLGERIVLSQLLGLLLIVTGTFIQSK